MARTRDELNEINKNTRFSKENQPAKNGRKKKLPALDALLAEILGSEGGDVENSTAKEVFNSLVNEAKKGNVQAAVAVLNRAYGMPKQALDIGGQKDNPLQLKDVSVSDLDRALAILEGNG